MTTEPTYIIRNITRSVTGGMVTHDLAATVGDLLEYGRRNEAYGIFDADGARQLTTFAPGDMARDAATIARRAEAANTAR